MSSKFRVTPSKLRQEADALETLSNQFKQSVTTLRNDKQSLASKWKGEANTAFNQAVEQDLQKFDQFLAGIKEYSSKLRDNAQKYEDAENKNTSIARVRKA